MEVLHLISQIQFDLCNRLSLLIGIGTEDRGGVDVVCIKLFYDLICCGIKGHDGIDLIAKKINAQDTIGIGKGYVHRIPFDTEFTPREFVVIAHILRVD